MMTTPIFSYKTMVQRTDAEAAWHAQERTKASKVGGLASREPLGIREIGVEVGEPGAEQAR